MPEILACGWQKNAPIYCLDANLLRDLKETDVPNKEELLGETWVALPLLILLFPKNSIHTPDNAVLDYALVNFSDRESPEDGEGEFMGVPIPAFKQDHRYNLSWCGMDSKGCTWFGAIGINDGKIIKTHPPNLGDREIDAKDLEFLESMENLVWNILLLMAYEPETVQTGSYSASQNRRGHLEANSRFWSPRFLKEREAPSKAHKARQKVNYPDKRASPHPHQRKMHWKRVAVGEGRSQRKWVRIKKNQIAAL